MQFTYIIALLFALIVAAFALLNAQPVTVDFAFNEFQISLALVILISAAAGAIILGFLGLFHRVKENLKFREMSARVRRLEGRLKGAEEDLAVTHAELEATKSGIRERDSRIRELTACLADKDGAEGEDKGPSQNTK